MEPFLKQQIDRYIRIHRIRKGYTQSGGSKESTTSVKHKGHTFIVDESVSSKEVIIAIQPIPNHCGVIIIDTSDRIGVLVSFRADPTCAIEQITGKHVGKVQMNFILHYLRDNKERLQINELHLEDRSSITCGQLKIKLADLYMLTHGDTWYGSFGFVPQDIDTIQFYGINKGIMKNASAKKLLEIYPDINKRESAKNALKRIAKEDCKRIHDNIVNILITLGLTTLYGSNWKINI